MVERQSYVNSALNILLGAEPSRLAILGGGGFGKTTLVRSLCHEPKIAEHYTSRFFLSCEGMADVEALLLGVGNMLGIKASPSAILASARRILANSITLLCLDNFETPWEPSATRPKVEDFLVSIADIPNLSLVITIRGTQRPSKIAWSYPFLPPLLTISSQSARIILQTISPGHIIDEATQNLLDAVDGIPLAITLLSNLLRDGETSQALWIRWSKEQTNIVENGGSDRESNLNASIALSVDSHRMQKDPNALTLLAALSLLPNGFPLAAIEQLEGYLGINDVHKALQILRTVALVTPEVNPSRIKLLSPVRLFCLSFLSSKIRLVLEKIVDYYIDIILPAENYFDNAELYAQIIPEIPNVHSSFQRVYKTGYSGDVTRLIDATSYLTDWSGYIGYISQDSIKMALKSSGNFPILHAKCLGSLGDLYNAEGQHKKAETCFRDAAVLFNDGNVIWEAWALYRCGEMLIYMVQLDQAEVALKRALELYAQADDKRGQANVYQTIGQLYTENFKYSEAESSLKSALQAYKEIPDLIGQANAAENLARLYLNCGNLVEAETFATEALAASKQANNSLGEGNALGWLGRIYLVADRIANARHAFEQALIISRQQNNPINHLNDVNNLALVYIQLDWLSAAEMLLTTSAKVDLDVMEIPSILITLGRLYICAGRLDIAELFLDNALQRFRNFGHKGRQAEVLAYLGTVYLKSNRLDEAMQALKIMPNCWNWNDIEIHRLWILGDLYIIKGELEDAEALLNTAMAHCRNGGYSYSYQQGNILRSIGALHVRRSRIGCAIRAFKRAHEFHCKAQWISEQATDLKQLGEAYKMLGRFEEAAATLKEGEDLMESVHEKRTLKL